MIELVIVYCLTSDPASCVERRDPFGTYSTPMGCEVEGQRKAAEYLNEHPAYRLQKWGCEVNVPRHAQA